MTFGCSIETTYEARETRRPGQTSSVTHAPPTRCRASRTQTLQAGAREVGRGGQPVVAGADDDRVERASAVALPLRR